MMKSFSRDCLAPTVRYGALALTLLAAGASQAQPNSFLSMHTQVIQIASTIPGNGDVNPYGVARVPVSVGKLQAGSFLISNFNDSANAQGTGTTIVQISPTNSVNLFASINPANLPGSCPGGVGLTTAVVALRSGWVVVGSLPAPAQGSTPAGTAATAQAGCLLVLNNMGDVVETISGGPINGPWDMTAVDDGGLAALFVTNVLNGTVAATTDFTNPGPVVNKGTVVRVLLLIPPGQKPRVINETIVGSGFSQHTDPAALVVGPTGVALDLDQDVLYVADTGNSRIAAIRNPLTRFNSAGTGATVSQNDFLNGPLGIAVAPNGNIITANAGDGNLVETTPGGNQVAKATVDTSGNPPGSGTLFGLAVTRQGVFFVDDGSNTFNLLH
jgi:hypothetical protein